MIPFEMNASNFGDYLGGGSGLGTRLAPGGVELSLAEYPADADTLALYCLHRGSLADQSGHGYTLVARNGAAFGPDGLACLNASAQCASTGPAVPLYGFSAVTLECWARHSESAPQALHSIAGYYLNSSNQIVMWLTPASPCPSLYMAARLGGVALSSTVPLTESEWAAARQWAHWALVVTLNGPSSSLTFYLNGQLLAGGSSLSGNLSTAISGNGYLSAGATGVASSCWDGLVDELRLSSVARYAAPFTPARHAADGTFTSPTFDCQRQSALWLPPPWVADLPDACSVDMETRAADLLDALGAVDAPWQSLALADQAGRYAQWRATLARQSQAAPLARPTLTSVTALASEAGANLYHGLGPEAAGIDYHTPVARFGPAVASHDATGLACPAVHWFGLRSTDAEGRVSPTVDAEVRLELDAAGAVAPARPAPVESLQAAGAGGGRVRLSWLALEEMGQAPPEVFRIYANAGSGPVDFATLLAEVPALADGRLYQWTSEPLADGLTVTFAVRAETSLGGLDPTPAQTTLAIDAAPPRPPAHLAAHPTLAP